MYLSLIPALYFLSSLIAFVHSRPFTPQNSPIRRLNPKRAPYSVVAVDGGPSTSTSMTVQVETQVVVQTSEQTKTTTDTLATTIPPSTATVVSTLMVTASDSPVTIEITTTEEISASQAPSTSTISTTIPTKSMTMKIYTTSDLPMSQASLSTSQPTKSQVISVSSATVPPGITTPWLMQGVVTISGQTVTSPLSVVSQNIVSSWTDCATTATASLSSVISSPTADSQSSTTSWSLLPQLTTPTTPIQRATSTTFDNGLWHTSYLGWNMSSFTTSTIGSSTMPPRAYPASIESSSIATVQTPTALPMAYPTWTASLAPTITPSHSILPRWSTSYPSWNMSSWS